MIVTAGRPPAADLRIVHSPRKCQMKRMVIAMAMSLCVVSVAAIAAADTLIMNDGTRVQGTVLGIADGTITFRLVDGESRWYPTSQVEALEFHSAGRTNSRELGGRHLTTRERRG